MKIKPLFDKVVLKKLEVEETTKSGIILPKANKEVPQQAKVISVGEGGFIDGKDVKMVVKIGDIVVYSKYAGSEVKIDEEEYVIVRQSDILAILE